MSEAMGRVIYCGGCQRSIGRFKKSWSRNGYHQRTIQQILDDDLTCRECGASSWKIDTHDPGPRAEVTLRAVGE